MINIKQMAKKAGVSVATISRAMNTEMRHKIAAMTLEKVDHLIAKYNYTPHLAAKNLRQTSTKTIGVIFPYFKEIFHHSYYVTILAGIADYLLDTDYQFKMLLLRQENKKWDTYNFKIGERVDGLIVTHWSQFFSDKKILERMDIPAVVINDFKKDMKTYFVCGDQLDGGRQVAEYLYNLGHRKFGIVTGPATADDSQLRLQGFKKFLKKKNISLKPNWIISADFREDVAYERVEKILSKKERPTAIFCLNDRMAFGVLRKMKDLDLSCPEEISLIGFDDDPRCQVVSPPLTSTRVPLYQMAATATELLVTHLQSRNSRKVFVGCTLFPACVVERNSVQKAKR